MHPIPTKTRPLALAAALVLAAPAHAATSSWICTFGYWDSADCWSPLGVPGTARDAVVNRVGGAETILVFDDITGTRQVNRLFVDGPAGGATVTFEQWGGSLTTVDTRIGNSGRQGRYLQTGGQHKVTGTLTVGGAAGEAIYDLRAGSLTTQNSFLGLGGDALFLQSGGVHRAGTMLMTGGSTTYEMTGGELQLTSEASIGGSAWFIQSAGSVIVPNLNVGTEVSSGRYDLNVGATAKTLTTNTLIVRQGSGMQQGPGSSVNSQVLRVGDGGGHSRYWVTGGSLSASAVVVGGTGQGSLHLGEGANTAVDALVLGEQVGAHGEVLLWGPGQLTATQVVVAQRGTARVLQTHGVFRVGETMDIGPGGVYDLAFTGHLDAAGARVVNQGRFNHTGGRFTGTLENHGEFLLDDQTAGTLGTAPVFAGHLVNHGTVVLTRSTTFGDGLRNESFLDLLPAGRTLTLNGQGLTNNGIFVMAGGTLQGNAAFVNTGQISGHGRVAGLEINNFGTVQQGAGTLVLAPTSGAVFNYGRWDLQATRELQLDGSHVVFDNLGSLALAGGRVSGSGQLLNRGVISGSGMVLSRFQNSGSLVIGAGEQFTQMGSFSSDGLIDLHGASAVLSASSLQNRGLVVGQGRVMADVSNQASGRVVAEGGVLTLADKVDNAGLMVAEQGATLLLQRGMLSQTGTLQFNGGTVDLNGTLLRNAGVITGHGTLRGHVVDNAGRMLFSAGNSQVLGTVDNLGGGQVVVSGGGATTFHGTVMARAGSELRVSEGSVAVFFGSVHQATGALFTGSGTRYFEGSLSVGDSPGLGGAEGDVVLGAASLYRAEIGGTDAAGDFDRFVVGGAITFGGTLQVIAWDGFEPLAGQRFDLFDWASASGAFAAFDFQAAPLAEGLAWDTTQLYVDGSLAVVSVPEPQGWALALMGCAALGARARWRPSGAGPDARSTTP